MTTRILKMAETLHKESRHHFITSYLDEVIVIQHRLKNLTDKLARDRREYEAWLDERLWKEQL